MGAGTRAKYEEWKWNRIKKRIIFPGIGLLFMLVVLIFMIVSCSNGGNAEGAYHAVEEPTELAPAAIEEIEPIVYLMHIHSK